MKVKAITFDFGGTLAHGELDRENYKIALLDYFYRLGFAGGKAKFSKARQVMLERLKKVREKNKELRFEELYAGLLIDLDLAPSSERLEYIEQLYYQFFKIDLVASVREMLEELSQKYNLAIISNIMSNVSRLAIERFGLKHYFDHIVLSRDLGIRKPAPEIFKFTLTKLGVNNDEAVHVGDSLEDDVAGAKQIGMRTVWIKNDKKQNINPDFVISDITELRLLF